MSRCANGPSSAESTASPSEQPGELHIFAQKSELRAIEQGTHLISGRLPWGHLLVTPRALAASPWRAR